MKTKRNQSNHTHTTKEMNTMTMMKRTLLTALATGTLAAGSATAAPLVYEGFDVPGDYTQDARIPGTSPTVTGFSAGAWGAGSLSAGNVDYEARSANMTYTNFVSGGGSAEGYESRTSGTNPTTGRSITRSLNYAAPGDDDFYMVFGWATDNGGAMKIKLDSPGSFGDVNITMTDAGAVSVGFSGSGSDPYSGGTAHIDGTWNLLIIRAIDLSTGTGTASNQNLYDDYELWLNPTITPGAGGVAQLGAPTATGQGVFREDNGSSTDSDSYSSVGFTSNVGSGESVFFDEFYITKDVNDFIVPEPGSLALMGLGGLCILRRRRG